MTRQLITNSYYGQPNTSNKISAGIIDVNITDSINLKLNINDIAVLNCIMGLDFIDFKEWKNLVVDYNLTMINQKKANARQYTFYFKNNENFDFSTDPFNGEKEIFFSESKQGGESFYKELQESIVKTYFINYNGMKREEKNIKEKINIRTSITYLDDNNTFEIDSDEALLAISDNNVENVINAVKEYLEKYYENTIIYIKKYISKDRAVENIEKAKIFDDNVDAIIDFGNKEKIEKDDILNLLRVFFPEYDVIE